MTADPLKPFGQHLAWLRKQRGWSQEKLALESGMARSYLSGIERGRRNVALLNIWALATTLGVPPSELLDFTAAPRGPVVDAGTPAQQSVQRSMKQLERADQELVNALARALARRSNVPEELSVSDQRRREAGPA